MPTLKNYDPACLKLAEHFVQDDVPAEHRAIVADKLAQHVQREVESWLEYESGPCDFCGQPRYLDHPKCVFF
jgi:hypothetical protein